ncbi:MAG: hypothetical protein ABSE56_14365 [Bryobacteraceae bacterium]|jgi:hypothetical protein
MPRTDLFLKVQIDHDPREPAERIAEEICRAIRKVYGVRSAELSSLVSHQDLPDGQPGTA